MPRLRLAPRALRLGLRDLACALACTLGACTGGGSTSTSLALLSAPALVAPTDQTSGLEVDAVLRWEDPRPLPRGGVAFDVQIAADAAFQTIEEQALGIAGNEYRPAGLQPGRGYHWRVRAHAGSTSSPWGFAKRFRTAPAHAPLPATRPVIYQLVVRHFGNVTGQNAIDGDIQQNGCGKFADVNADALRRLRELGVTHVWLTGILQQATLTDWSAYGQPADDPDIVKGRAGSFYAVKDYYDVSPDYAVDPAKRLEEFDALLARVHQAGLKVLIDLVPNHVARSYQSDQRPTGEPDLGEGDDQAQFFARDNAFFYLQADPGRALALSAPAHWRPQGLDGAFGPEDGGPGRTARVTGDNVTSYTPDANNWYETVKLNYGENFADPASSDFGTAQDRPATWLRMQRILAYWVDRGVDGFRCDFAHFVPDIAWSFLIDETRAHAAAQGREVFFIAEAYDRLDGLLAAGFDAVYDDATYDTVKSIYTGTKSVGDLDQMLLGFGDADRHQRARYLENHDERRIASPLVAGAGNPDDSGFGSAERGRHVAPLVYLAGSGPVLFYNGQEVGETGAGTEGFGGADGRTSIFDYWRLERLSAWVNEHRYDGAGLTAEEQQLRAYYRRILTLANHPYARGSRYYGLNGANAGLGAGDAHAFARFETFGGGLLVVVTNFGLAPLSTALRVPLELGDAHNAGLAQAVTVRRVLDPQGGDAPLSESTTRQVLDQQGIPLTIPAGSAVVLLID